VAKRERSGSGFFWGLVIGIAVGATIVWVLTPQPGEITRARATTGDGAAKDAGAEAASGEAASATTGAMDGAQPTIIDLAMAAVERVRARMGEAVALGREAYEQGQAEVMQRFNQARTME
jgi:gas vesicle protein